MPWSATLARTRYSYAWYDPYLVSGIGVGFTVGGGLTGFTDRAMRDTVSSNVGGLWDARASFGTHIPIGLDVGYIGSAANINTIDGNANGTLVGTTVEAALRYNILPHNTFNPYIFAGAGWQHYDVTNMHFAQSDTGMAPHDNVAEFPMGAGFGRSRRQRLQLRCPRHVPRDDRLDAAPGEQRQLRAAPLVGGQRLASATSFEETFGD